MEPLQGLLLDQPEGKISQQRRKVQILIFQEEKFQKTVQVKRVALKVVSSLRDTATLGVSSLEHSSFVPCV